MAADTAGAMQEAHHGALRWGEPCSRPASHTCRPGLPVGISLQTITSLSCKVFLVLFLISRRQLLPSSGGTQECFVKSAHPVLDVKTESLWIRTKAAPCFELRNGKTFNRGHYHHSEVKVGSSPTGSMLDISTYITSRDLTSTCTQTKRILVLRKKEKLKNAALRENYRPDGANEVTKELLGSNVTVVSETLGSVNGFLRPPEAQKYLRVIYEGTLKAPTEWTSEACRRYCLNHHGLQDLNKNLFL